jgi:superfamily II DNA or RNA helicase
MPTGAGKTRTHAEMVRLSVERGRRALWLAHRAELVDQAVGALTEAGVQCGAISASAESAPQPFAPVQVATIQTLLARKLRPQADIIVVDEAHHYVAGTWLPFIADYPDAIILGPTATPERSDGRGLGELFRRIVVGVRVRELVAGGHLVPANLIAPPNKLKTGQIAQRPVDAYLTHARGQRAIVFSPSVALAREHAEQFKALGVPSAVVTGETSWADRRAAFKALETGAIKALCNVFVATEGFDVPSIGCVILARGIGSSGGYIQMVGRALRPSPETGKREAVILDLCGTSHIHGHPEDDRQYSLTGRGIRKADDGPAVDQVYCRVCGAPIEAGAACPECGTEPRDPASLRVTGEKLIPYARKRAETTDQRAATLARWMQHAATSKKKDGGAYSGRWALVKFRAVYGEEAPRELVTAAKSIAFPPTVPA